MSGKQDTCINCKWWYYVGRVLDPDEMREMLGACRRHAPVYDECGGGHPSSKGKDWCGDFLHKDDRAARLLGTKYMSRSKDEAA